MRFRTHEIRARCPARAVRRCHGSEGWVSRAVSRVRGCTRVVSSRCRPIPDAHVPARAGVHDLVVMRFGLESGDAPNGKCSCEARLPGLSVYITGSRRLNGRLSWSVLKGRHSPPCRPCPCLVRTARRSLYEGGFESSPPDHFSNSGFNRGTSPNVIPVDAIQSPVQTRLAHAGRSGTRTQHRRPRRFAVARRLCTSRSWLA